MPRGRAQVSMVCSTLPAWSRIVSVLLFSFETNTLPVAFASRGWRCASCTSSSTIKNRAKRLPPARVAQARLNAPRRLLQGQGFGTRWQAADIASRATALDLRTISWNLVEETDVGN